MLNLSLSVLLTIYLSTVHGAPQCENGWMAYKDELCIKLFTNRETYESAKAFCSSQADQFSQGSLVMVKDGKLQEFLTNVTNGTLDYVWLGGKYNHQLSKCQWEDGENLEYTNWLDGYPKNFTQESDSCIEIRSSESIDKNNKWTVATCHRQNLVLCQKLSSWSLQDAVTEIINLRKQLKSEKERLEDESEYTHIRIDGLKSDLYWTSYNVVPVGSIYIEYYDQPSPKDLWVSFVWKDVTDSYAGLFFRALGGDSGYWGYEQDACAPRITHMQYDGRRSDGFYPTTINIPPYGWSESGAVGEHDWPITNRNYESVRFYSSYCEVRPRNQAIRIWKRIA